MTSSESAISLRPLLGIVVLGFILRLLLWFWFDGLTPRIWDERDYQALAENLVEHREFGFRPGEPTSIRPPLYPFLLAGIYSLSDIHNYQVARAFQLVLSLVLVLVSYGIARELLERRAALWVAAGVCFYPSLLGFNNLILTEILFTLLFSLFCWLTLVGTRLNSLPLLLAAGATLGFASLSRSVMWLFPPFLFTFIMLGLRASLGRRLLLSTLSVVVCCAVIAPWALRNTRLHKTFITIDVMGGRNFMMGNYEHTLTYRAWDTIALKGEKSWDHVLREVDPEARDVTQGQLDKRAMKYAIRYVLEHPGITLQRSIIKFFDFWGLERELIAGIKEGFFGPVPRWAFLLLTALILGSYVLVLFSALFGMMVVPPVGWRVHLFLIFVMAFICGLHTLAFGHSRYHLPLIPILLVYSASTWTRLGEVWQRRTHWTFWLASASCLLFLAGWTWGFLASDLDKLKQLF